MDVLRAQYKQQLEEYNAAVTQAIDGGDASQISRLRRLNEALAKTLDEMVQGMTFLKKNTTSIMTERDELIDRLRQIQKEYNGLLVNTDELETLRRIREQKHSGVSEQVNLYFFLFLAVCIAILIYVLFITQRKDTMAPRASMPPTAAAFV